MKQFQISILLPIVNVIIAVLLLVSGGVHATCQTVYSCHPAVLAVGLINAPAQIARTLSLKVWERASNTVCAPTTVVFCHSFGNLISLIVFLLAIGVFWYCPVRQLELWRERNAARPWQLAVRAGTDIGFLLFGVFIAAVGVSAWASRQADLSSLRPALALSTYLAWSVTLISIYGRNLARRIAGHLSR